jgi:hypothetical protein
MRNLRLDRQIFTDVHYSIKLDRNKREKGYQIFGVKDELVVTDILGKSSVGQAVIDLDRYLVVLLVGHLKKIFGHRFKTSLVKAALPDSVEENSLQHILHDTAKKFGKIPRARTLVLIVLL